ncbi:MAG: aspartate--tRNA ligase [Candidatus Acidulodesulfobacterium acidiphilum]|uniref:Aspartate--tRNA(Asp/Asn) ligase n=1 Tax=Candidatus Acidulodesulfobacterium acidiphilum TaxID=2597224 RepID=A0A520XER1_9DELT|nr:MAG: aspartate--tRNA ligase [Candidatus Acidulodesulfobacterium acidiphilum]
MIGEIRLIMRTLCEDIKESDIGKEFTFKGWVMHYRDHGGLIFIDLRDYSGILQIVFDENIEGGSFKTAKKLRNEYVIAVSGTVRKRPEGTENDTLKTGSLELAAKTVEILNTCEVLPFQIDEESEVNEFTRLKYRYLDLRSKRLKDNLIFRSKFTHLVREFLDGKGFFDIETPFLTKSTPEGSRDFLVPSRLNNGRFFALPQSPQLFKQILMVGGFERYYQIVRCFRDEDLRADRQPEFTQLDMEMSFVENKDVISIAEELFVMLFEKLLNVKIERPFKVIDYDEAMDKYGSDKPDTRFELIIRSLTDVFENSAMNVFKENIKNGGVIKAVCLPDGANLLSRKDIDELLNTAKDFGAKGLAWTKVSENNALEGGISKFISDEERSNLIKVTGAKNGDIIFYQSDSKKTAENVLGRLRLHLAKKYNLINKDRLDLLWVVNFPLFEYSEEEKKIVAVHHPFTSPAVKDIEKLETDPLSVKSDSYDLVLNGEEIGGGSIRIHNSKLQETIFKILSISPEDAKIKFGFLLDALSFGAPPHGGIAFGLDRILMILRNEESIRDVIAFPKTQKAYCPLTDAPSGVNTIQLRELGIKLNENITKI